MDYKDVSAEIASVSQSYSSHKLPPWLLKMQELMQQMWLWLQEFLNYIFQHRGQGPADTTVLSTLLQYALYVAGIIALIVICYLLWRRAAARQAGAASTRRGAASVEKILDSQGYRRESARLSGAGDFKGACRALYLCLLQYMHEANVATFAPAKTNYEYRYLLLSFPELQSEFIQLANIVEQIWFGNKQAFSDDYAECLRLLGLADIEVDRIGAEKARLKAETDL